MIYTKMTKIALKMCFEAHKNQVDKSGMPYVFHPFHLAEQMQDEITCTVALLHDTIEDTSVTLDALEKEFPPEVTDAVALLTHDENEDYFDYVRRIKDHPVAKCVKLADLNHNSDQSRCIGSDLSPERLAYWREKYSEARRILTDTD